MKTGWKVLWGTCGVLAVAGVGMGIAGVAMGGLTSLRAQEVYREDRILQSGSMAAKEEVQEVGSDQSDTSQSVYSGDDNVIWGWDNGSLEYSNLRELEVELSYIEVDVRKSDTDTVLLLTEDLPEELGNTMMMKSEHGKLEIEASDRKLWKEIGKNNAGRLIICLPEDLILQSAEFQVGAGILNVEDTIRADELSIDIGTGTADIQNFEASEFDLEVGTGSVSIAGTADREVDIECGVGEVEYHDMGKRSEYNYEIKCGMGSVSIDNEEYGSIAGEKKIKNNAAKEMDINCGLGTVTVTFESQ